MSELWLICICIKVKRVEGDANKILRLTQLGQSWIWVYLWRAVKKRAVMRARRSENEVKRYILAQLGPVGTSVPTLALYLFICIQVTA